MNYTLMKKMFLVFILVLLIPFVSFYYFVINVYTNDKKNEALNYLYQINQQTMQGIDNYVLQLKELTKQPLYNSDVLKELRGNHLNTSSDSMIHGIMATNKNIYSAFIINLKDSYIYSIIDNSLVSPYYPSKNKWFQKCMELNGRPLLVSNMKFDDLIESRSEKTNTFFVARAIKDPMGVNILGVIAIYTRSNYIGSYFSSIRISEGDRMLMIDEEGNIVYDTKEGNITKSINDPDFDMQGLKNMNSTQKFSEISFDKKQYAVVSVASNVSNWRLVRVLQEDSIYKTVWDVRNRIMVLYIIFFIFSLFIAAAMSHGITKPLKKLILTMKLIEKGDFSLRFKVKYKDEVGLLGRNFNKMMRKIDNLVNIVHVTQLHEREAELQALQAQINPHFVYNTLESIRMTAIAKSDDTTAKMSQILGKLLRYSINIKNKVVTINEELEHLNNYVFLQNSRFDNKFLLNINIDKRLYDIKIIKLVFQPIVENAIYHALESKEGVGVINITGYTDEHASYFDIKDNGGGMSEKQLENLNYKINDFSSPNSDNGGIGLRNINERIKLFYGSEYGLTVFSQQGEGTTVRLKLPEML